MKDKTVDDFKTLREFVDYKGINKEKLKQILGVSHTTLYTWLNNNQERERVIEAINKMADNIKVSKQSGGNAYVGSSGDQLVYSDTEGLLNAKEEIIKLLKEQVEMLKKRISELEKK